MHPIRRLSTSLPAEQDTANRITVGLGGSRSTKHASRVLYRMSLAQGANSYVRFLVVRFRANETTN